MCLLSWDTTARTPSVSRSTRTSTALRRRARAAYGPDRRSTTKVRDAAISDSSSGRQAAANEPTPGSDVPPDSR